MQRAASLVLADGTAFAGWSFGAEVSVSGEAVFQTGMVGYPESLTDPSYEGQILVLTYPLVGNYGVASLSDADANGLPLHVESGRVHIAALVVGTYSQDFSHWTAMMSLGDWLKRSNVPAIHGIDTRALTKKIRTAGVMLGKIVIADDPLAASLPFRDPNVDNLVATVSTKERKVYEPTNDPGKGALPGDGLHVVAVDVGMKYNQIRCFTKRGIKVTVVPWDYDFNKDEYDGLFISNGPGDPTQCVATINHLRTALQKNKPIFGICLGHQLLALAAGAKSLKMKFGNRGQNLPCIEVPTGRCYITSQNHGFAVDTKTLPAEWKELFKNANDDSNEGIYHTARPFFSVQFHPEATPGPKDTEYLFDRFIELIRTCKQLDGPAPVPMGPAVKETKREHPSKVLILGSGGLSIGQAGEFDYSGSQAIKALKQEGIYTVLINPNIATIQTSKGLADKVYFLPVNAEYVRKVILFEKPEAILVSFGGQTALNVGVELKDDFKSLGVRVLGTPIESVILTEDRELFAQAMLSIGERCAKSSSAVDVAGALAAAKEIGYPVIVRAAYALGGLGSGFANNDAELVELCNKAFAFSPQVLVERSMRGWKEIEYEVVRDVNDNCITVCNMENFDPLGIHTGDSIVVAPSQTLTDHDYFRLRSTAVNVIRHLKVVGECNIQYAVNPDSDEYCIIEVNARLSRSSALASKATGYPLAYVAAKLALGIPLTEIRNSVTQKTCACFEPSLDYCVVKIPRWDLKKFSRVSKKIASAMKSVGEVMAIGRTFEETIQKAIRAIDHSFQGFEKNNVLEASDDALSVATDQRLFAIANALHSGYTVDRIWELTKIDKWFLNKLLNIVKLDRHLSSHTQQTLTLPLLRQAKQTGFADSQIARCISSSALAVRSMRVDAKLYPFVKQIDTVAAEFPAFTNYLYMTYNGTEHDVDFKDSGVMVLGSGVYRIGSSVEFDWCAVRAIRTIRAEGVKTIMVNYNPETVSTDYDEADKLYFENITLETVMDIYELEQSSGIVLSMGGQTPNNIALQLHRQNVRIYGTSPEMIDTAENRYKFSRLLDRIGVNQPQWKELTSIEEANVFCSTVGYPVLVRPSYVLSGAAMNVVFSQEDLEAYLNKAAAVSPEHPVVISKYIQEAKEIEMDAVASKGQLVMHVISEHVENAGVHSGDATLVLPPQDLDVETVRKIEHATRLIADALNVTGPFNIQFIAKNQEIKVIECNLRASRSFPFDSRVMGVDLIQMATRVMLDWPITPYPPVNVNYVAVKVPQFSFSRLSGADPVLGVEMASTGEVACFGKDKYEAYIKALVSTGFKLPRRNGNVLLSVGSFKEKNEFLPSALRLVKMGFKLFATPGTADFLAASDVPVTFLDVFEGDSEDSVKKQEYSLTNALASKQIDLYINLPSMNNYRRPANYVSRGYLTRRMAVDFSIPLITNIKCAKLFVEAVARADHLPVRPHDFKSNYETVVLPGLIDIHVVMPPNGQQVAHVTEAALAGGFTMLAIDAGCTTAELLATWRAAAADRALCNFASMALVEFDDEGKSSHASLRQASPGIFALKLSPNLSVSQAAKVISAWPQSTPLITCASGTDLAAILLLANINDRRVHVGCVTKKEDMKLIQAAKTKGMPVTCDVSVHSLFLTAASYKGLNVPADLQLTAEDQEHLWKSLPSIDCFSVAGRELLATNGDDAAAEQATDAVCQRLREALPLLLTAVLQGKLTLADVKERLYDAPMRLFGLPQPTSAGGASTTIEVEIDRDFRKNGASASITGSQTLKGVVTKVTFNGKTVYQDGRTVEPIVRGAELVQDRPETVRFADDAAHVKSAAASAPAAAAQPTPQTSVQPNETPKGVHALDGVPSPGRASFSSAPGSTGSVMMPMPSPALASLSNGSSAPAPMLGQRADRGQSADFLLSSPAMQLQAGQGSVPLLVMPASAAAAPSAGGAGQSLTPVTAASAAQTKRANEAQSLLERERAVRLQQAGGTKHMLRHLLSVKQLQRNDLHSLFALAQEMKTSLERDTVLDSLRGKIMCTLFYEPSTRTSASFDSAMKRLGGQVVNVSDTTSSIAKGETLQDTIRTVGSYVDVIILRHPGVGSAQEAAKVSPVSIINAGDGTGEHPTQALLDIFTMREELGSVNGLHVTLVGDLKNGRTVHSLVRLLALYKIRLAYVSVPELAMPREIKDELAAANVQQTEHETLSDVISYTDVLYVTRVQKERFTDLAEYERVRTAHRVTAATLARAKDNMIVMHPLPRVDEIDPSVDRDPRAAYFRQMRNGLYVRMALLLQVFSKQQA